MAVGGAGGVSGADGGMAGVVARTTTADGDGLALDQVVVLVAVVMVSALFPMMRRERQGPARSWASGDLQFRWTILLSFIALLFGPAWVMYICSFDNSPKGIAEEGAPFGRRLLFRYAVIWTATAF